MITDIPETEEGYIGGLVYTENLSLVHLSPRNPYIHSIKVSDNMSVGDYETILTDYKPGTT